jgi:hypothetical protein
MALAQYWCSIKGPDYHNNLYHMLPYDINSLLVQLTGVILGIEPSEDET